MAYGTVNVGQEKSNNNDYVSSDKVGVPGGVATLDGDGKLTESQRPDIDAYTKAESEDLVTQSIAAHDSDTDAHGDIRASIAQVEATVKAIELKYSTDIQKNPFSVSFSTLSAVTVTGVWNEKQARIEF